MHKNQKHAVMSSCKIVALLWKPLEPLNLQESLCPGYIEKLENGNPKGSDTRKQKYEFQCVLLAKISSFLELCNVTKSLLTGWFSYETIYYLFRSN